MRTLVLLAMLGCRAPTGVGAAVERLPLPPSPTAATPVVTTPQLAASTLLGAWAWGADVIILEPGGTGQYNRNGALCYLFTYEITGDRLSMVADRDGCNQRRANAYVFVLAGDKLRLKHIKSGFESTWHPATAE